jgi:hypothetical protein
MQRTAAELQPDAADSRPAAAPALTLGKLHELAVQFVDVLTTESRGDRSLRRRNKASSRASMDLTTNKESSPMNLDNAGELVSLGTDIVKLGAQLKEARAELEAVQAAVKRIEGELQPKLIRHAELIQQAAGLAFPAQPPLPPARSPELVLGAPLPMTVEGLPAWAPPIAALGLPSAQPAPAPPAAKVQTVESQLKQRVKDYLKRQTGEEGISATDVADVLKVDALLVREAMREMKHGR